MPGLPKRDVPQAGWERIRKRSALWFASGFRGCFNWSLLHESHSENRSRSISWHILLFSTTLRKPVSSENNHVSWMFGSMQVYFYIFYLVFFPCFYYFLPKCTTEPLPPVGVKRLLFKSARVQCSLDQISGWVLGFLETSDNRLPNAWRDEGWISWQFKMSTYRI